MSWVIKNRKNQYLAYYKLSSYYEDSQSKAQRFDTKEKAKYISDGINKNHYCLETRIVKIKTLYLK